MVIDMTDVQILDTPSLWQRAPQPGQSNAVDLGEDSSGYFGGCAC